MTVTPRQTWWTAAEIAASGLPGMPTTKRRVNAMAAREGWQSDPMRARRRLGRGGGWEYSWELFPLTARRKLLAEAGTQDDAPARMERGEAWAWFDGLPQKDKDKARHRLAVIEKVDALERGGTTRNLAVTEVARLEGVSARTIWNWRGLIEGIAPEDRLPYLADQYRSARPIGGDKGIGSPEFWERLKALYLRLGGPAFRQAYRDAARLASDQGWEILPERTARRRLDELVPRVVQVFAREGEQGLARCFPPQVRDRTQMAALEGVNADAHKIDVFVEWEDGTINRPQIVVFQDLYSGKLLSWRVDHSPNKVAVMAAFGDMIEGYGIPRHCLFDNGREFANKWLTGGTPTRFRFKVRDDDPLGVLPMMGIKVHWAQPGHGQAKPIERGFRDFAEIIAKDIRFAGAYTGNRPDAKPENYGSHAVPIETFLRVLDERIDELNARPGRLSPTCQGRSFDETFAESYASAPIRKATDEQRRLWLMGQDVKKLDGKSGRFKLFDNFYWSPWMAEVVGQRVTVRFDPEDLHAGAYVYGLDGAFLGYAECQQKIGFFDAAHAKAEARQLASFKRAHRALLKQERALGPKDLAAELDALAPAPAASVEAKVVRPEFGAGRGNGPLVERPVPQAQTDPEAEARRESFVAEFKAPAKPERETETKLDRLKRALDIEARLDRGAPVGTAEMKWFEGYATLPEYRSQREMYAEFGEAMFAK
ncbi:transposase domain-containing protein [Maritimibacter sp. HL-12]|uniref:transposase domain-containing protein n=1 Tax=Maritimibacter sp. HL-12 TaxID=1162418 RepID=UPI000A0F0EB3|nr:transposase domain-containing protein [Maritimibacter sp. HL-12]SMH36031.1 Mu DNA-binding domain-containing protein [Maritimibacter sp. HL-12]